MRKIIFAFLAYIYSFALNAFEFSWEKIFSKLQQPLPQWMESQIQEDLEPFSQENCTIDAIDSTIRDVYRIRSGGLANFVRYEIKNNKISVSYLGQSPSDARIAHVLEVLEDMAQHLELPDIDFLVCIWDSYDNPLFLEKTYCPVFAICKILGNQRAVLFPEFRHFSYRRRLTDDIEWTSHHSSWESKEEKAFWRGMTSGGEYSYAEWDLLPRPRFILFSQEHPDLADAAFTSPYNISNEIKVLMEKYGLFQSWHYPTDFVKFKYLVSIDGNTFASNFWWQLLSNCAVMKGDSGYLEWFYKGLKPYVHYLPYSPDLSDFEMKITWLRTHDDEAKKIADQGRVFAQEHLSNEDLVVYFYKLLMAYSNIQKKSTQ